jgi:hypothetical protein
MRRAASVNWSIDMNTLSYLKMMSAWLDAAKACGQLAMAATFLPIFFLRQVGVLEPIQS